MLKSSICRVSTKFDWGQWTPECAGTIYLLHFNTPFRHARQYLGFALNLKQRLDQHAKDQGARLKQVVLEAGIGFDLARTWPATRTAERRIKNRKEAPRLCPVCKSNTN